MTCNEVRERLILLEDDDLAAEEAVAVRAHLAGCEACATARRGVADLVAELHSYEPPAAPPGLRERIALALDTVDESKIGPAGARRSPWEAVAFYVAAAAVILMALAMVTVMSRPGRNGMVAQAPPTYSQPAPTTAPAAQPPTGQTSAPPAAAGSEAKAVDEAIRKLKEAQEKKALADRDGSLLHTPDRLPPIPSGGDNGGPAGTLPRAFAEEGSQPGTGLTKPLTSPTMIELSFLPPAKPAVGEAASGVVEVVAREEVGHAVVTAIGDAGLMIDKRGGVLYEGPLRAGESVRVPLPLLASTPGSHEVNLSVTSNAPGGNAQLKVFVPGFSQATPTKPAADPADKPVHLVFQNAPIRQALMDIAKQASLRLEIAEGLGAERISRDVRGVPARAALRAVAEAGGYQLTEDQGVFRVAKATDAAH